MSLTVNDLIEHKKSLERQATEIQKAIEATRVLIDQMRSQEKEQSVSLRRDLNLKGLSMTRAARNVVEYWKGKEFTTRDVFNELTTAGLTEGNEGSARVVVDNTLRNMLNSGVLQRKNVSKIGRPIYAYFWSKSLVTSNQ